MPHVPAREDLLGKAEVSVLEPDVSQAVAFFAALFPVGNGESIHFRGVPEPHDDRGAVNLHYALDEHFASNLAGYLEWCKVDHRAAFFLPGVVRGQGTGKSDVLSVPAIVIDFDKDDPDANLTAVENLIGPATIVVESGGRTELGPKLHAYWRLAVPASGAEIGAACEVREILALAFGGDPAFKQSAQVIRVPGSIHYKATPTLVRLRKVRPEAEYALDAISSILTSNGIKKPQVAKFDDFFNFNNVDAGVSMDRVLLEPVHAGAVDDITRFDAASMAIGHYIRQTREGRMSPDACWLAVQQWNAANMVPPWEDDRLRRDFQRLVDRDVELNGPLVHLKPVVQTTTAEGWSIAPWRADRFSGPAPERVWLVEGLIPAATAGVFAAVGDAGKSMLALQLALRVATSPVVQPGILGEIASPKFFGCPIVGRGAAVILTAEDDAAEVHRRLNALDPSGARSRRPLYVVPMLATGGPRSIMVDGPTGPLFTEFWDALKVELAAIPDLRLVVLDPLSSFVSADINKDNVAGAALMGGLGELAAKSGASVMLVHHFAKAATPTDLTDARTAIRGAGSLVDNGRWSLVLWEAEQEKAYSTLKALGTPERAKQAGVVYLGGLAKGNAPGAKMVRTLVRDNAIGVLEDVTDTLAANAPRADEVDDMIYKALVAHHQGRNGAWSFPISFASVSRHVMPVLKKAKIDITDRQAHASIERLTDRGLVVETAKNGHYEPSPPD